MKGPHTSPQLAGSSTCGAGSPTATTNQARMHPMPEALTRPKTPAAEPPVTVLRVGGLPPSLPTSAPRSAPGHARPRPAQATLQRRCHPLTLSTGR
ncbi:hypothetical protein NDU88_007135 [Pleurodeles waltl]|uniref:Uncharacterized protein n=1 Tax=Pleurodeles waltl TaxID=8319 RepID=A0AAV7US27_PLEWA|nr:hypothetical protein NDU88_007135 [Pleurodeles waltl]